MSALKKIMAANGAKGGKSRSKAKLTAARKNLMRARKVKAKKVRPESKP